jgi:hypothetical protein
MYRGNRGIVSYSQVCERDNHSVLYHHLYNLMVISLAWNYIRKGGKQMRNLLVLPMHKSKLEPKFPRRPSSLRKQMMSWSEPSRHKRSPL